MAMGGREKRTDHSDSFHVAICEGKKTLSCERHLSLFVPVLAFLVALFAFEFTPEGARG